MKAPRSFAPRGLAVALVFFAAPALAQPLPPAAPPVASPPPVAPPPVVQPVARQLPDPLAIALAPQPGGLTPEDAARVAAAGKPSVKAKRADLEAAAARVDQALVSYFPRVSVTATYTRLSE